MVRLKPLFFVCALGLASQAQAHEEGFGHGEEGSRDRHRESSGGEAQPAPHRHAKRHAQEDPGTAQGASSAPAQGQPAQAPKHHRSHQTHAAQAPGQAPHQAPAQRPERRAEHRSEQRPASSHAAVAARVSVPAPWRKVGVSHVPVRLARRQVLVADAAHSAIVFPGHGPQGQALHASIIVRERMNTPLVHEHLRAWVQDRVVLADVHRFEAEERIEGRYYWHHWRGQNYCHYYDHWGYHWYGWYLGDQCFWVRNYHGGWWWHDPLRLRWCYWYDGFWWWQDPLNLSFTYVYNGSDYVPSEDTAPAPPAPGPAPTEATIQSTPLPAPPPDEIPSLPSPEPGETVTPGPSQGMNI